MLPVWEQVGLSLDRSIRLPGKLFAIYEQAGWGVFSLMAGINLPVGSGEEGCGEVNRPFKQPMSRVESVHLPRYQALYEVCGSC